MARQYWSSAQGPLHSASGASYNTSTTLTDISPGATANPILLPAGSLDIGTIIRVNAHGSYATSATTPTLLLGVYYGGVAGTALATCGTPTVANTATANWRWQLYWEGVVQATGTSGSIFGSGWVDMAASLTTTTHIPMPVIATAAVTVDTTVQKAWTIGGQWGTSAAANIAFCYMMSVETLN